MNFKTIFKTLLKKYLIFFLNPLKYLINIFLIKTNYYIIWRSGKAIGDQLLMAGLAKILKNKFKYKIIVITNYSSLLSLSPYIYKCISISKIFGWYFFYYLLKIIEGKRILEYNFPIQKFGYKTQLDAFRSGFYENLNQPPIWHAHVADRLESKIFKNFTGGITKPNMSKTKEIIKSIREVYPNYKIGIINPIGKTTYTKTKAYGFKNYQEIVNLTYQKIKWLQVGLEHDFVLDKIHLDLRGNSLRFLVDIIAFSDLILADEGLLNHIGGSFPRVNSYVSFSEFSPPKYYSYKNTITLGLPDNYKSINFWQDKKNEIKKSNDPELIAAEILNIENL